MQDRLEYLVEHYELLDEAEQQEAHALAEALDEVTHRRDIYAQARDVLEVVAEQGYDIDTFHRLVQHHGGDIRRATEELEKIGPVAGDLDGMLGQFVREQRAFKE